MGGVRDQTRDLSVTSQLLKPNHYPLNSRAYNWLLFNLQQSRKYLGYQVESEIANLLELTPQLVKLGINMEFRDTLNRTVTQLQKNLDLSNYFFDLGCGCSTAVEHMPRNRVIMGSNPAGCWAFFSSLRRAFLIQVPPVQ